MPLAAFHPAVRRWFSERLGEPTAAQRQGWPSIASGKHTLIAAPTGSGKTLTAFLWAIDQLLRQGDALPEQTQVLYVSPLKALGNDIRINLQQPLEQIRELDPSLAEIRVLVRTGDTAQSERAKMLRTPPHILVSTPESLYILLTSEGGRRLLSSVRTVIVDEIHALTRDKRGSHLALSLERLVALCGEVQRIGLSATQKPLSEVGDFLVGTERSCELVDTGHLRELDLGLELPGSPLSAVCSHEVWEEIYQRMVELIEAHRTTLVFVNTRKMAERVAARLSDRLGTDAVTSHHGSLAKDRRLDAEQRLKNGQLRALVATASLELGIDVGDVDLVIQVGVPASIATFLQRVGRAGHGVGRIPRGRLFPLTRDELVCAAAMLWSTRRGELDRTPQPGKPLDILAQQVVAECVAQSWSEDELFARLQRAWPYRTLTREEFDEVVALHCRGRYALLHRDGVGGVLHATKRARITAMTSGGAIPDQADYQVIAQPDGMLVGTLNEDFAIESNVGDIFQLGNTSWAILRVERGGGARRRRRGPAADLAVLVRRSPGAHRGAVARGLRGARAGRRRARRRSAGRRHRAAAGRHRPDRRVPGRGGADPGHGADRQAHRPGAVLRRDRRHAAGGARAVRRAHQPGLRVGAAQTVLPPLRLRAAGRRQRGGVPAVTRPPPQLSARGSHRLPAPEHRARGAHPGGSAGTDVPDAVALERHAIAGGWRATPAASGCRRRCCGCAPRTSSPARSRRQWRAARTCRPATCRCRSTTRWCGRRSTTA